MNNLPRRRRDTWLQIATIIALVLQVVVAAFPDICPNLGLTSRTQVDRSK